MRFVVAFLFALVVAAPSWALAPNPRLVVLLSESQSEAPAENPFEIFGADLFVWLKSDDPTHYTLVSGAYSQIVNQVGTQTVDQGMPVNRPTQTVGAGPGGQDIATFDAADIQFLIDGGGSFPDLMQPFWAAAIFNPAPRDGQTRLLLYSIGSSAALRYGDPSAGDATSMLAGGLSIAVASPPNAWQCAIGQYNGTSSFISINGGPKVGLGMDIGTGGFKQIVWGTGAGFGPNDSFMGGTLEIMLGTNMNDSRLAKLQSYCHSRGTP